jgi:hypothetical protein
MQSKALIALIPLIVTAQACCCCAALGGPQPPYTITPSNEAVQRLEERMDSLDIAADGSFSLTVTEEEMTSLLVQMMEKQEQSPPISQPQVYFRNGRVEVYATVPIVESLELPGMVAFTVAVVDQRASVTIEEIALGPLPVPDAVTEALTDMINETFAESTQTEGNAIITGVEVGDKEITFFGKVLD